MPKQDDPSTQNPPRNPMQKKRVVVKVTDMDTGRELASHQIEFSAAGASSSSSCSCSCDIDPNPFAPA